jgi:PTH1 family peptidyl-tRNA hydrolase
MKLIVGLGNPDKKYQNTRHNLGQNVILGYIKTTNKLTLVSKPNLSAKIYESGQGTDKTIFAISTDYMNNSGLTVQKIANFYKISPENIYIIHDDLDLPVGEYKIQFDRGSAGHNGIKSIIEHLNTQQFNRIRVGIGKIQNNIPAEDYVLLPPSSEEEKMINKIITEIYNYLKEL